MVVVAVITAVVVVRRKMAECVVLGANITPIFAAHTITSCNNTSSSTATYSYYDNYYYYDSSISAALSHQVAANTTGRPTTAARGIGAIIPVTSEIC